MKKKYDAIIIGAGAAGVSAAIWGKRLDLDILLVEKENGVGGQLYRVGNPIIDYPGVRVNHGKELAALLQEHLSALQVPVLQAEVAQIDPLHKQVITSKGSFFCDYLILATGARDKRLHIPGEQAMLSRGEQYSTTKERHQFAGKKVLVVGGGDRAIEGVLNVADVAEHTWLVHRSSQFRAQQRFIDAVQAHPNVTLLMESHLIEIGDETALKTVRLSVQGNERTIPMDRVLIRIGMEPDNQLVREIVQIQENGSIEIDAICRTSVPWIFAIGDVVTAPEYRSVSWSVGQGMVASKSILVELMQKRE